jgi:pyridinium-3,5-bisthiocarboxylic acid mononucleotide nickel chelatase
VILWLNPFAGISGDMLLGALLDLGAPLAGIR